MTFIPLVIRPLEYPFAMFKIHIEIAIILSTIIIFHSALAMHHIIFPLTLITFVLLFPNILTLTFYSILYELTNIIVSIAECQLTLPLFKSILILTFIFRPINVIFITITFLLIIFPTTFINPAHFVSKHSKTTSHILDPHTFIYISIKMSQFAISLCIIIIPLPTIQTSIAPNHQPISYSFPPHHLSNICCTVILDLGYSFQVFD